MIEGWHILAVGHYQDMAEHFSTRSAPYGDPLPTTHYSNKLIIPGLIDTHIHFPQGEMIAAYGEQLLTWLDRYTFPTEQKFSNEDYAFIVAHHFLNECGTPLFERTPESWHYDGLGFHHGLSSIY